MDGEDFLETLDDEEEVLNLWPENIMKAFFTINKFFSCSKIG